MAIELTTASDSVKKAIRDSLKAVGVSGNNSFTVNGDMIATTSITITGTGTGSGVFIPNGIIRFGSVYTGQYTTVNDGANIYFHRFTDDDNELRIDTYDNGDEPIVLRQNGSGSVYEPLIIGKDHNIGIGNVPVGTRNFENALTVYGNISASGDIFVQSIIESSQSPLVIDVNSTNPAVRITQTGSGDALVVEDSANPDSTPFIIKNDGKVSIGGIEIEADSIDNKLTVIGDISATGTIFAQSINSVNVPGVGNIVTSPSTTTGGISGITEIKLMDQTTYDLLTPKLSSTLYIIV